MSISTIPLTVSTAWSPTWSILRERLGPSKSRIWVSIAHLAKLVHPLWYLVLKQRATTVYEPLLFFLYVFYVFSYNFLLFFRNISNFNGHLWYISLQGGLLSLTILNMQVGKCDSFLFLFCFEAKTTPTVKCYRWFNIISPKIQ